MIVVEFTLMAAHFTLKPFETKGGNVFSSYLAITRLVCTALMIPFIQQLNVKAIPRVVIGIIIAIIFSVSIIVVILNLVLHAIGGLWRRQKGNLASSSGSTNGSQGSMSEKGIGEGNQTPSDVEKHISPHEDEGDSGDVLGSLNMDRFLAEEAGRERPVNPTPNQSTILVPYMHNEYQLSPTGTVTTTMDPPSIYSHDRDSGTMTVGSLLPSRWSLSFSQPSSPVGSAIGHQNRTSLTPSPLPTPSHSDNGAHSRNASLRLPPSHQMPRHQHDDIQEEPLAT